MQQTLAPSWRVAATMLFLSLCFAFPAPALAQQGDAATETVNSLNQRAMERYGAGHHAEARLLLKKALRTCNTSGLANSPAKARTHVNMGVVLLAGFRDKQTAIAHFRQAVRIQADIAIPAAIFTPEVASAFKEASVPSATAAPAPASAPAPAPEPVPAPAPVAAAPAYEPGAATRRPAAPTKRPVAAATPAPAPVAAPAPAPAPASELPPEEEGMGPEANADVPPLTANQRRFGTMPGSTPPAAPAPRRSSSGGANEGKRWNVYLGVSFGVGVGYAIGKTETLKMSVQPGVAWAEAFHVSPEIGFYTSNNFMIGALVRYQSITSVNVKTTTDGTKLKQDALAGLLKLTWMPSRLGFRPYFNLAVGGGSIRHVVKFPQYSEACGGYTCLDNVAATGFMVGPGLGFFIDLGSNLHLLASVQGLLIAGPERTTFNADFGGGLALSF